MKKQIFTLGLMLATIFTLTNCTKQEVEAPQEPKGTPFTIQLSADTKTENDGLATKWVTGDQVNVFHAEAGTTDYLDDNAFTVANTATGIFTGEVTGVPFSSDYHDWYFFYPYTSFITSPANTTGWQYIGRRSDEAQVQIGNDSKAHLAGTDFPLVLKVSNLSKDECPSGQMKQIASVIEVKVKNTSSEPLTVTSVSFTGTESVVGQFIIDFSGDVPLITDGKYVSSTANLKVSEGTALEPNEEASFFIGIKPFTAPAGGELRLTVNGYEKPITLQNDVTFASGKIKYLNFNYNKDPQEPEDPQEPDGDYEPGVTWTLGTNSYDATKDQTATVNDVAVSNLLKLGTSKATGKATIDIPAGTVKLGFYCVGWKGKNASTVKFSFSGEGMTAVEITPQANVGAANNAPYTLTITTDDYYYVEVPSGVTTVDVETISKSQGRVLLIGMKAFSE